MKAVSYSYNNFNTISVQAQLTSVLNISYDDTMFYVMKILHFLWLASSNCCCCNMKVNF